MYKFKLEALALAIKRFSAGTFQQFLWYNFYIIIIFCINVSDVIWPLININKVINCLGQVMGFLFVTECILKECILFLLWLNESSWPINLLCRISISEANKQREAATGGVP